MAIKLICDLCDKEVKPHDDLVETKEFVHEQDGKKICLNVELAILTASEGGSFQQVSTPALCLNCASKSIYEAIRRQMEGH